MLIQSLRCLLFALPTILLSLAVQAQPVQSPTATELAVRRQLIEQALREHEAGNHEASLEHAQQALRIQVSASLLQVVAQEQNLTGRYADALSTAERCRTMVRDPNHQVQDRQFVLQSCDEMIATLPARAGHVILAVPSDAPTGLRVRVATVPISSAVYNLPYLVNPGTVHIEAELDGQIFLQRDLTLAEGATVNVPVTLPAQRSVSSVPNVPAQTPNPSVSVGSLVVLGTGVALLGTSLALFVVRNGAIARLEAGCDPPDRLRCDNTLANREAFQTAGSMDLATGVVFGVGVAATVGGMTWLIVDRVMAGGRSSTPAQPRVSFTNSTVLLGIEGSL